MSGLSNLVEQAAAAAAQRKQDEAELARRRISLDELEAAWKMLNPRGGSTMSLSEVEGALSPFMPDLSVKQLRGLCSGRQGISLEDLQHLLVDDPPAGIDPHAAAFELLDSSGSGFVDNERLRDLLARLHNVPVDKIDLEDMQAILQLVDADMDGLISAKEFAQISRVLTKAPQEQDGSEQQGPVT